MLHLVQQVQRQHAAYTRLPVVAVRLFTTSRLAPTSVDSVTVASDPPPPTLSDPLQVKRGAYLVPNGLPAEENRITKFHRNRPHITINSTSSRYRSLAQLDMQLSVGQFAKAEPIFLMLKKHGVAFDQQIYSRFLNGWVQENELLRVRLFFDLMLAEGLSNDTRPFCIVLEYFAQIKDDLNMRYVLDVMQQKGMSVYSLNKSGNFVSDTLEKTLRKMVPSFDENQWDPHAQHRILVDETPHEAKMKEPAATGNTTPILDKQFTRSELLGITDTDLSRAHALAQTSHDLGDTPYIPKADAVPLLPEEYRTRTLVSYTDLSVLSQMLGTLQDKTLSPSDCQIKLELSQYAQAQEEFDALKDDLMRRHNVAGLGAHKEWVQNWTGQLTAHLHSMITDTANATKANRRMVSEQQAQIFTCLKNFQPEDIARIAIEETVNLVAGRPNGVPSALVARFVATRLYDQYVQDRIRSLLRSTSRTMSKAKGEKNATSGQEAVDEKATSQLATDIEASKASAAPKSQIEEEFLKIKKMLDFLKRDDIKQLRNLTTYERLKTRFQDLDQTQIPEWPEAFVIELGSRVVDWLVEGVLFNPLQVVPTVVPVNPASSDPKKNPEEASSAKPITSASVFYHSFGFESLKKRTGMLCIDKLILDQLSVQLNQPRSDFIKYLPMVIKPAPWTKPNEGGYILDTIFRRASLMRIKGATQQRDALFDKEENRFKTLANSQLRSSLTVPLRGLNALQDTPWRVNPNIFDVMARVWNNGGDDVLDVPTRVDYELPKGDTYPDRLRRRYVKQKNAELHSMRCDFQNRLLVASFYLDHVFYLPHNLDFRGRAYPIPTHLSHMGADKYRALMMFAEAKPLGPNGLRWLFIHLANCFGQNVDKRTLEGRYQFGLENLENIRDSARDPLGLNGGKMWWKTGEDMWQLLAVCFEISAAIDYPEGPEKFPSCIAVQMDGSCNGLQHYAALGGDIEGARAVNLLNSDKPGDVYSRVAERVAVMIKKGVEENNRFAKILEGKVTRKVVKQTVMTNVYGVTFLGGRDQIMARLAERGDIEKHDLFQCSFYVTKLVFDALRNLFTNAKQIQDWLAASARQIAGTGHAVSWVTPIGLPCVQPYHKRKCIAVQANRRNVSVVTTQDESSLPDTKKQKTAFPPNFIHSLDSTHMLMTADACYDEHVTFASVHDSFWTHAATTAEMNRIIRQQFIRLHQQPIIQDLKTDWERRYGGKLDLKSKHPIIFADLPKPGELDVTAVLDSEYFFS